MSFCRSQSSDGWSRGRKTLYDTLTYLGLNMLRHDLLNSKVIANLRFVARVYLCVRFGLPCSSFSTIQHLNKGSRTKVCPEGKRLLVKTREAPTCGCANP